MKNVSKYFTRIVLILMLYCVLVMPNTYAMWNPPTYGDGMDKTDLVFIFEDSNFEVYYNDYQTKVAYLSLNKPKRFIVEGDIILYPKSQDARQILVNSYGFTALTEYQIPIVRLHATFMTDEGVANYMETHFLEAKFKKDDYPYCKWTVEEKVSLENPKNYNTIIAYKVLNKIKDEYMRGKKFNRYIEGC